EQLKERTMQFALGVLDLVDSFPPTTSGFVVGRQLAKSATSVPANYRATCVARSRAEFVAKLGIVVEEADESELWLDIIVRRHMANETRSRVLHQESKELRAIFGSSLSTARARQRVGRASK